MTCNAPAIGGMLRDKLPHSVELRRDYNTLGPKKEFHPAYVDSWRHMTVQEAQG